MQILSNEQVSYCNVVCQASNQSKNLPGILYQNKLFIKDKFFFKEQKKEALNYSKQKFLEKKGEIMYLLLEDNIGLTIWIENNQVKLLKNRVGLDTVDTLDLNKIVAQMRNIGGIKIQNRRYHLITYPNCFVGSEAVDWITANLDLSVEQAVRLGQRLITEKMIHHVTDEQPFINGFFFYRFYWDEL